MAAEELRGEVAAVVFANAETGFGVVEVVGAEDEDGARATGPLAALVAGQCVRLLGRWTDHERYGPTFAADAYEQTAPSSVAGLQAYLASDRFPGVGQTLAQRITERFGLELGEVLAAEPQRLTAVKGVSAQLAKTVAEAWRSADEQGRLVATLSAAGLPARTVSAVLRAFGDGAPATVAADPYAVLGVAGVAWAHAETLARAAGVDRLDPRRLVAGAVAAERACCASGHLAVEGPALQAEARRLLGVDQVDARRALDLAEQCDALVRDAQLWWAPDDLEAERTLASELARLLVARSVLPAAARSAEPDLGLTAEQRAAVRRALSRSVSVLTGGPGTGKTRTVVALVDACEAHDLRVALCAPTGRAAKRLEELTGRGATTIHRLLEARGDSGDGFTFGYGAHRRLPHDVVVADEWSMADTALAAALASAVGDGAHLVAVGDADQLPSVGPGAVLRDLVTEPAATVVPATRLTAVHRQAAASRIVTLAHEINAGTVATPRGRDGDVFAVPEHPAGIADRVAEIVAVRAPAYFGVLPADVQVLAPMYRGAAGVDRLNVRLKERLNPARGRRAVAGFHEGDRVVQTRNDVELDVANGDLGEVVVTDAAQRTVTVAFASGTVTYDGQQAADLAPAWCLTVHKAQGGEWPVVVVVLDPAHRSMLWRELVYTAVTRARSGLLLVGDPGLVTAAARRSAAGARPRRTALGPRLVAAVAAARLPDPRNVSSHTGEEVP